MSRSILLVPSVEKGNGSGHLVRCLTLAHRLKGAAAIYIPETSPTAGSSPQWTAAEISLSYARELSGLRLVTQPPLPGKQSPWDLIILDKRATSLAEFSSWARFAPVLAIDEGGEARDYAHFLIDILPRHPRAAGAPANRSSLGFLDLPRTRRRHPAEFRRVLISFGGEDGSNLSCNLGRLMLAEGMVEAGNLTIVLGALNRGNSTTGLKGVTLLGPVQDLKEHLSRYDLVITQFGLTAFEAAWAGCGVILMEPSRYHLELSRASGFPELGLLRPDLKKLEHFLHSPAEVFSALEKILPKDASALEELLSWLSPAGTIDCPVCGSLQRRALYRTGGKSYFRCGGCGTVSMMRFGPGREAPYKETYFFEEYKEQYGKTYLEDWPALTALAAPRLHMIEEIAKRSLGRKKGLTMLDVGCAYGPFVAMARGLGQEPYGLDASESAANYVRSELGIPATAGDFLDPASSAILGGPFDVLSMWYVIEHFDRLDRALRNAAALVRPGGILAMSTPSLEGTSGRFRRASFFENSPEDHFTIWEPSRVRALLKAYGFRLERLRITGHHPERLPGLSFLSAIKKRGPFYSCVAWLGGLVSRAWGLGDTFEIYAIREAVLAPARQAPNAAASRKSRPALPGRRPDGSGKA